MIKNIPLQHVMPLINRPFICKRQTKVYQSEVPAWSTFSEFARQDGFSPLLTDTAHYFSDSSHGISPSSEVEIDKNVSNKISLQHLDSGTTIRPQKTYDEGVRGKQLALDCRTVSAILLNNCQAFSKDPMINLSCAPDLICGQFNSHNKYQQVEYAENSKDSRSDRPKQPTRISDVPADYEKYVFDPPKSPKVCPPSRRKTGSQTATSKSVKTEAPTSNIFLTLPSGRMYEVRFSTQSVSLSPLYIDKRYVTMLENEKKVQPDHIESTDAIRSREAASHILRPKYELSEEPPRSKQSKAVLPPLRVYTGALAPSRRRANSEPPRNSTTGFIYLNYKDMMLRIRVPPFPLGKMKPPVSEDIIEKMHRLGMPTSESRKNKATIVVRCGPDLHQFKFDMTNITVDYVELRGSAAVQTEDKMVYIKEKSMISGRMLLVALPETTYFYQDPTEHMHRLNSQLRHSHVVPLWKYELMRARLADREGSTQFEEKLDKIYQQTRGSRFFFEGLDCLISAQTGLLCCEISRGQRDYEDLMLEYQGQKPQRKRPPIFPPQKGNRGGDARTG